MAKMIYNLLQEDKATKELSILVAFESEQIATEWREDYIRENYGTEYDMNYQGIYLTVEPTIYQKGNML